MQYQHKGIKYYCEQCESNLTHKSNLVIHMKSKHEGTTYYCNQCDDRFIQKGHLLLTRNANMKE